MLGRYVSGHGRFVVKDLITMRTLVSIIPSVEEHVLLQLCPLNKRNPTMFAFVGFLSRVRLHVTVQRLLGRKLCVTLKSKDEVLEGCWEFKSYSSLT